MHIFSSWGVTTKLVSIKWKGLAYIFDDINVVPKCKDYIDTELCSQFSRRQLKVDNLDCSSVPKTYKLFHPPDSRILLRGCQAGKRENIIQIPFPKGFLWGPQVYNLDSRKKWKHIYTQSIAALDSHLYPAIKPKNILASKLLDHVEALL